MINIANLINIKDNKISIVNIKNNKISIILLIKTNLINQFKVIKNHKQILINNYNLLKRTIKNIYIVYKKIQINK